MLIVNSPTIQDFLLASIRSETEIALKYNFVGGESKNFKLEKAEFEIVFLHWM